MAYCITAVRTAARLALAVVFIPAMGSLVWAQEDLPWQQRAAPGATYAPPMNVGANDSYRPSGDGYADGPQQSGDAYNPDPGAPPNSDGSYDSPGPDSGGQGYGEPYSPPPQTYEDASRGQAPAADPRQAEGFEQNEILGAGHRFFGSISGGIANAVESVFKSQGRPNGYILGQDAGGAFILGLRYGEGRLYTKDAGEHPVFWQGPSLGYDAGGDGSKTMVLVYNLRDPSEIYERFGGVQGAAYVIGGVSVQIQKYNDVTLAVIRSGVGLRLGANVGYLKYTRSPTWNPL